MSTPQPHPHHAPIRSPAPCAHAAAAHDPPPPRARGCEECLRTGSRWVHLRVCLECGHVGCCDSSPNRHATKHFHATRHPLIGSFEPAEAWGWCYVDEVELALTYEPNADAPQRPAST